MVLFGHAWIWDFSYIISTWKQRFITLQSMNQAHHFISDLPVLICCEHIHTHMQSHTYTRTHTHTHTHTHAHRHTRTCTCTHTRHVRVCLCACVCVCVYFVAKLNKT